MTIHFKSTYGSNGKFNTIEFKTKLEMFQENEYRVLIFEEKRNDNKIIKNRIEFNEHLVNIYSGPSTLNLELNKKIKNNFNAESVSVYIWTYLKEIILEENKATFEYQVAAHEDFEEANDFKLELEWSAD